MHLFSAFLRYISYRRTADSCLRNHHMVSFLASVTLSWAASASPWWVNAWAEREQPESTMVSRSLHPTQSPGLLLSVGLPPIFWRRSTQTNQRCRVATTYFYSFMSIFLELMLENEDRLKASKKQFFPLTLGDAVMPLFSWYKKVILCSKNSSQIVN